LAFAWLNMKGLYPPELVSINLDVDWFYRRWLSDKWSLMFNRAFNTDKKLRLATLNKLRKLSRGIKIYLRPHGFLSRAQTVSNMTLWLAILLACYLALSFSAS